jgi:hypothetical protein
MAAPVAEHGHQINHAKTRYAIAEEAIAKDCIVRYTGDYYGEIEYPDADGDYPAGVTSQAMALGDSGQSIFTGELCWIPVSEAIVIGNLIMATAATGYAKVATSAKPIIGVALTAQSNVNGYVLVDMTAFGTYAPA